MAALVFNCPRCVYRISIDSYTAGQSVQCPCCRQYVLPPGHAPAVVRDSRATIQHATESASDDFDVDEITLNAIRRRKSGESHGATLVFGLLFGGVLALLVVMIGVFNWWKSTPNNPTLAAKVLAELEKGSLGREKAHLELDQGNLELDQRNMEIRQRNAEIRQRHPELQQRNTVTRQRNPDPRQRNPELTQRNADTSTPKVQSRGQSVESSARAGLRIEDHSSTDKNEEAIKEMDGAAISSTLEKEGFKIAKDTANDMLVCKRDRYEVEIYGLDGNVWQVRALVTGKSSGKGFAFDPEDRLFFGKIASLAYDGTDTQGHRSWAENHFDKDGKFDNGKCVEQTTITPFIRSLLIRPINSAATE